MSENQTTFAEIARKIADENPEVADYHVLSDEMMREITGQERDLLRRLLPSYMRAVLTRRSRGGDEQEWEDFLTERLATPGRGTIFVADATPDEMAAAVKRRENFAGNLDRAARRLQRVEKAMRAEGATHVRDLPSEKGADALHDVEVAIAIERTRRIKAEHRSRGLSQLQKVLAIVNGWVESRETPSVVFLRQRRDVIAAQAYRALRTHRAGLILDEVVGEMTDEQR